VLAFYYPWFDGNTWKSGKAADLPQTPYNSDDPAAMARHIEQAQNSGIDAFVLNWWGKGNRTEKNLKTMLDIAAKRSFRLAVDFDINSPFMGGAASYTENLRHLHASHASHPAYLRYEGRPVVFFYNVSRLPVSTWQGIRDQVDPEHGAIWIAEGVDIKYLSVFDGHHLYSITWPNRIPPSQTLSTWGKRVRQYNRKQGTNKLWVATVMPGYDDRKTRPGSGFVRAREGGNYYRACWQAAIASQPHWVVINSFNEWMEGSHIEPSQAHGTLYLELTHEWAHRFRDASFQAEPALQEPAPVPPTPTASQPAPAAPSPTPTPTPTSVPSVYQVEREHLNADGGPGSACRYVLSDSDGIRIWIIYCPAGRSRIGPGFAIR
jgi:hypothetical protein